MIYFDCIGLLFWSVPGISLTLKQCAEHDLLFNGLYDLNLHLLMKVMAGMVMYRELLSNSQTQTPKPSLHLIHLPLTIQPASFTFHYVNCDPLLLYVWMLKAESQKLKVIIYRQLAESRRLKAVMLILCLCCLQTKNNWFGSSFNALVVMLVNAFYKSDVCLLHN